MLRDAPMSRFQVFAVAICGLLAAVDGFDVVAITFAAPALLREWGVTKADTGYVLAAGLLGMAAGSLVLSPLADSFGRRRVLLASLVVITAATFWTAFSKGIVDLAISRLLTGMGLGVVISIVYSLAAEYSNARRRDTAVSFVVTSFGIGAISGGFLSAWLLQAFGWRAIFLCGGGLGIVMLLLVWRFLLDPLALVIARPGRDGLERANAYLSRCGHAILSALPPSEQAGAPIAALFRGGMGKSTLILTAVYFLYMIPQFYLQTWAPTLVADLGFSPSRAALVSAFFSVGGVTAGMSIAAGAQWISIKPLTLALMVVGGVLILLFSLLPASLGLLIAGAIVTGFFLQGGMVAFYVIMQRTFPVHARASGTGFVIGVGRLGSILPPVVAGLMFTAGASRMEVTALMAAPAIICVALLWRFRVAPPTLT
ncbi:hypothetical protein ASE00_01430 [Sphingomonas sp. Root710]|nr:hypothetical protein ASE00_01430 [Sphingomonas sp. Root710]